MDCLARGGPVSPSKPRYVRISVGALERIAESGVKLDSLLTLARIRTHPGKRSIPGLLAFGPVGLADALRVPPAAIRKHLRDLQDYVIVDESHRLLYVRDSIAEDPPSSRQAVIGMARQWAELPAASAITTVINREVRTALAALTFGQDRATDIWQDETSPTASPEHRATGSPEHRAVTSAQLLRSPSPRSDTETDPAAASETLARGWLRLPSPPFAAAADFDLQEGEELWSEQRKGEVIAALFNSKWRTGQLNIPPTLGRLIRDTAYTDRIIRGEFIAADAKGFVCPDCKVKHQPCAVCPPPCRGCNRHHGPETYCHGLKQIQWREESERQVGA